MAADTGELLSFEIEPNGDAVLTVSDAGDDYAHTATVTAQELAGIAEASRVARDTWHQRHLRIGRSHHWPDLPGDRNMTRPGDAL